MIRSCPLEITLPGYFPVLFFCLFVWAFFGMAYPVSLIAYSAVLSAGLSEIVPCCGSERDEHPAMKQ